MRLGRSVGALIQIAVLLWQAKIATDARRVHCHIDQRTTDRESETPPPPPGLNGLVLLGLTVLAWTSATVLTMWRLHQGDGVWDAVAYVSPILAAILAGGGIFARQKKRGMLERQLYWASVAMLGLGDAAYLLSKGATFASLGTFLGCMFVVLVAGLLYDSIKSPRPRSTFDRWTFGVLVVTAILSPGVLFFYDMPARTTAENQAQMTCAITAHTNAAITIAQVASVKRTMMVNGAPGPSAFQNVPTGSFMFVVPCKAMNTVTIPVAPAKGRTIARGESGATTLTPTPASSRP